MNDKPRFIQGVPALVFLILLGGAGLTITGVRLARGYPLAAGVAFVVGLGSGYLGPMALGIARMFGRVHMEEKRGLRWGLLVLFFLPLFSALPVFAIAPPQVGQAFGVGVLSMVCLGTALVEEAPSPDLTGGVAKGSMRRRAARALGILAGGVFLAVEGYRFKEGDQPAAAVPFVVGLGCGYIGPLAVRVADLRGRGDLEVKGPRGWVVRAVALLPFWSPLLALLVLPPVAALAFVMGSFGMLSFGQALLSHASGSAREKVRDQNANGTKSD